ncbi:MAG: sulfotransferase [Bacteroidota bacterium]
MSFLELENNARLKNYQKDSSEEDFLTSLNLSLQKFDAERGHVRTPYPWVFVTGLPRSGTTLLMQCLASAFDFCYINNLIARFWKAPVSGARLSKIMLGEKAGSTFFSDFGKTNELSDVHEWSYFWIEKLKYKRDESFDRKRNAQEIDWEEVKEILDGITGVYQKCFLAKALHPVKYVKEFLAINPQIFFIHIKRDFRDNCQSIYEARTKYYGDPNAWWSIIPDNYAEIKEAPYFEQIPSQLASLNSEMKEELQAFAGDKRISIRYEELCDDPQGILKHIHGELERVMKQDFSFSLDGIPEKFDRKKGREIEPELEKYIDEHF